MSLILNIDTALSAASISLCRDGNLLSNRVNNSQRDHAAWIHVAIADMISEAGLSLKNLDAVAVSHGPGSYTGLRIGLSTAKGLCFALKIPLITIPTLEIIAAGVEELIPQSEYKKLDYICPMIDARRMEVYFSLFDTKLNLVSPAAAIVLNENSFDHLLLKNKILFTGNGSQKFTSLTQHPHVFHLNAEYNGAVQMKIKSWQYYDNGVFADIALIEPLYIKEFYDSSLK